MRGILLAFLTASLLPGLAGCSMFGNSSGCSSRNHSVAGYCPNEHYDYEALLRSPCHKPFSYGGRHLGLYGFMRQTGDELNALIRCTFSDEWEGGYPYGAFKPWVGRWESGCCCCCCSDGGIEEPCPQHCGCGCHPEMVFEEGVSAEEFLPHPPMHTH